MGFINQLITGGPHPVGKHRKKKVEKKNGNQRNVGNLFSCFSKTPCKSW